MFRISIFYSLFLLSSFMSTLAQDYTLEHTLDYSYSDEFSLKPSLLNIKLTLPEEESLLKDSLIISIDNPEISIKEWSIKTPATAYYDAVSKTSKSVVASPIGIAANLSFQDADTKQEGSLHVLFRTTKQTTPQHLVVHLYGANSVIARENSEKINKPSQATIIEEESSNIVTKEEPVSSSISWHSYISTLVQSTQSLPLRLILVFLLGILLSLTPCIYPMIPITVGILQAQKSNSWLANFCLSLAYTMGIATTFAVLGLIAGSSGPIYGKFLMHPLFVLIIVSILSYLAFSMFGFYEIYIPSFLQTQNALKNNGSFISAFMCGAMSGTIASPCVSPGLILLLSIVATLGNLFLGFLLLFTFGVGLSMPLLLVGTFSSSLNLLPQAGSWMIEIKKIFGVMLIGASLYYLSNILAWPIILILAAVIVFILGLYYVYTAQTLFGIWKNISLLMGSLCLASSLFFGGQAYKLHVMVEKPAHTLPWVLNYQEALAQAKKEHKKVFIDIWAQYCSICKAINNNVFPDPAITQALKSYVLLNVDGTYEDSEPFKTLKDKYAIVGFPSFIILDPHSETVVHQWSSEIYHMKKEDFAGELRKYA